MTLRQAISSLDRVRVPAGVVVFVVAFCIGTAWTLNLKSIHPFSDYLEYHELAENLLEHGQFGYPEPTARRLPAYPALLAGLMRISRSELWLNLANVVLFGVLAVLVHDLARRLTQRRDVAMLAALICALNPTFVFFSPVLGSEHLFAPLVIGSMILLLHERIPRSIRAVLAGLTIGIAVLTRGEGLFYVPVLLAIIVIGGGSWRRRIVGAICVCAMCAVTVVPWIVRNRLVMGPGAGLSTTGASLLCARRSITADIRPTNAATSR